MNNVEKGIERAVVLWLSGVRLEDIRTLPAVIALQERGALVELDPAPITGPLTQHYQAFSGKFPASFGLFDSLVPRNYSVDAVAGESVGRGLAPKLLPDLLRTVGWTVRYEETSPDKLVTLVQQATQSAGEAAGQSCLIVKCASSDGIEREAIDQALRLVREWVGEDGLLALLSDTQPVP